MMMVHCMQRGFLFLWQQTRVVDKLPFPPIFNLNVVTWCSALTRVVDGIKILWWWCYWFRYHYLKNGLFLRNYWYNNLSAGLRNSNMRKPEETFYGRLDLHLYWTCPDLSEPLQGCPYDLRVLSSFFLKRKCFEKGHSFSGHNRTLQQLQTHVKRNCCKFVKAVKA